ncbi:MAG: hypothetical protein V8S58_11880, partial [Lachnospiraceae bacterium]
RPGNRLTSPRSVMASIWNDAACVLEREINLCEAADEYGPGALRFWKTYWPEKAVTIPDTLSSAGCQIRRWATPM